MTTAKAKQASSRPYGLPLTTAPMEALRAEELPHKRGVWQYEPKWDGFRCLVFKHGKHVDLRAKSGKPLGRYFPEVVDFIRKMSASRFVVDGELVIQSSKVLSFGALQMRLHPAESRIRKLSAETPAKLILFDMLVSPEGDVLVRAPLRERRAALKALLANEKATRSVELSPATTSVAMASKWLGMSGRGKTDGVVAKRLEDPYASGERAMIKVKRVRTADCVIGGFRYESNSELVGSLLLGLYDQDGRLNHVGFTSTISDADRPTLTARLNRLRKAPGFDGKAPGGPSRWSTERSASWEPLKPTLVVEVRFDQVTDRRFRHGTKLVRWRPDKAPSQCRFDQIN